MNLRRYGFVVVLAFFAVGALWIADDGMSGVLVKALATACVLLLGALAIVSGLLIDELEKK